LNEPRVKFGVHTALNGVEWSQLLEFWHFLDRETAFHSIWTFDHFVPPNPGADPSGPCLEGWAALAALAQATERLRVGCLVTGNTYRHPAVLAKMAATVDHISNGRLEFGIGAGWHEDEHTAYGIPFYTLKERQDHLEEAVQLIRALFQAESPVDFEGRYYQLRRAPFSPPCVQRPHPPIMVGGSGEKRTLRTAARYGDMINVSGPPEVVRRKIEVLEEHCQRAGRDPAEIVKSILAVVAVTDDQGTVDFMASATAASFGLAQDEAKRVTPVGSAEHVRGVVERYAELGVTYIIVLSEGPWKREEYARLSDEVVSAFR